MSLDCNNMVVTLLKAYENTKTNKSYETFLIVLRRIKEKFEECKKLTIKTLDIFCTDPKYKHVCEKAKIKAVKMLAFHKEFIEPIIEALKKDNDPYLAFLVFEREAANSLKSRFGSKKKRKSKKSKSKKKTRSKRRRSKRSKKRRRQRI